MPDGFVPVAIPSRYTGYVGGPVLNVIPADYSGIPAGLAGIPVVSSSFPTLKKWIPGVK